MPARIVLATTPDGIARAALRDDGTWSVGRALPRHAVVALVAAPGRPGVVYAGGAEGAFHSVDGGHTWTAIGTGPRPITAMAISPIDPDVIFAGVRPKRLVVSRDAGASWTEVDGFRHIRGRWAWFSPASFPFTAYVQAIVPSPIDPKMLTIGVEFGATVRTTDGGVSWSGHLPGSLRDCHGLSGHAANPAWMYEAGGTGAGVAFRADDGRTWRQPSVGLDRHYGWPCAADPEWPGVWYVSLSPGPRQARSASDAQAAIFRMGPGGWERLAGGLPQPLSHMPYCLHTDPSQPETLYAGLAIGDVWQSADHGDSWTRLPFSLGAVHRSMVLLD